MDNQSTNLVATWAAGSGRVLGILKQLRRRHVPSRPRLVLPGTAARIYAIGDIHGCLTELKALEAQILDDARDVPGEKWIVTLGDHVDRGPSSAAVLDHIQSPLPEGWHRFSLAGNHEAMMQAFLERPRPDDSWLDLGGMQTLLSFGMPPDQLVSRAPKQREWETLLSYFVRAHVRDLLAAMPVMIETPDYVFVHAGIEAGRPLEAQDDELLMNMADDANYARVGRTVVHGHILRSEPLLRDSEVSVDTGAFATGVLTAAVLGPGHATRFLSTKRREDRRPNDKI